MRVGIFAVILVSLGFATDAPTSRPSGQPSMQPSGQPSAQPSGMPSMQPSSKPSAQPSSQPSAVPSGQPSMAPSCPSGQPSSSPSSRPSSQPSSEPSGQPTGAPTSIPSSAPTPVPIPNFISEYPPGCDTDAAAQCEYEFTTCRLFSGPVNDPDTLCSCGADFYGNCLRRAGCEIAVEVAELGNNEVYMRKCVNHIRRYDCPEIMTCAVNCATETTVDRNISKIIPFNNYGPYYLRVRVCKETINTQRAERYSLIQIGTCEELSDFEICNRWIPPMSFTPVALPQDAKYVEVDLCEIEADGSYNCHTEWDPQRIFGNSYIFPSSFDIDQSNSSICRSDADCLGTFCDDHFRPPICSPKTMIHVDGTGANYFFPLDNSDLL